MGQGLKGLEKDFIVLVEHKENREHSQKHFKMGYHRICNYVFYYVNKGQDVRVH